MKNGRKKEMPARQLRRTDGKRTDNDGQSGDGGGDEDDAPVSAEFPFSCMALL